MVLESVVMPVHSHQLLLHQPPGVTIGCYPDVTIKGPPSLPNTPTINILVNEQIYTKDNGKDNIMPWWENRKKSNIE